MNVIPDIMSLYLKNRFSFWVMSKILTQGARLMRKQDENKKDTFDLSNFLIENELDFLDKYTFNGKDIYLVREWRGRRRNLILKTSGVELHQAGLMRTVRSMTGNKYLPFKVPELVKEGDSWLLMEDVGIDGVYINDFFKDRLPELLSEYRQISDAYKAVVSKFLESNIAGNLLEDGRKWLFSRLLLWSSPLIDAEMLDFDFIKKLGEEFESVIKKKGEDFFGWIHGNVIGDHVIISENTKYLLDLNIVPRAGGEYYDFLRALDWTFLKSKGNQKVFNLVVSEMQSYAKENGFDYEEMKLVFAFRMIGILGWDVLERGDSAGDNPEKQKLMLRFIKREY